MHLRNKNNFIMLGILAFNYFAAAQAPPTLDELSETKIKLVSKSMEAAQLQQSIAAKNVQDARDSMQQLVIALEAKYPGYTLNMQTGGLIAKPQEKKDKPAEPIVTDPRELKPKK